MSYFKKILFAIAAVACAFMLLVPQPALADTSYIETWDEYKAANNIDTATWNVVAGAMDDVIDAGRELYANGDSQGAYKAINKAYYGYYETTGFERVAMGYIGNGRKSEVELQFATCKSTAKKGGTVDEFNAECDELSAMLHEDADILDGTSGDSSGGMGAAATFAACLGIIVREGIEAILVIGAIIAYLVKSGNKASLKQVYIGAILGIVCSFIAAWALNALKLSNAAPQEIIEGCTALVAVVVLYWVSNWMLSKSESKAWDAYIKGKVASSVATGSMFAMAFTAWLAVFREGAEVVLFYQPLLNGGNIGMVWAGFGVGCVVIAIIFILMRYFSVRLPLKPFFIIMSVLMFIMSISFLGGGIKELIEGDVITMTPIPWIPSNPVLEVLGIYPCVETVVPQILLLIVTVIIFVVQIKRSRKLVAAAEAQDAEAATAEAQDKVDPAV